MASSSVFDIKEHVIPGEYVREYARATAESQNDSLVIHVKQYTPKGNGAPRKGDLSIIGAHANGFPKVRSSPVAHGATQLIANTLRFPLTEIHRSCMSRYGKTW